MLIIPAIDLHQGCVVRFVQGKKDRKIYSKDPLKVAKHWAKLQASMLHIVDLDGAFSGKPAHIEIIKKIAQEISIPIECGGGIRSGEVAKELFDAGVNRIILGTKAVSDKKLLTSLVKNFGNKVLVSIDAKSAKVMTEGWKSDSKVDVISFGLALKEIGVSQVVYTDTMKDGMLEGPNIKDTKAFLKATGLAVIASGGVSSIEDLKKLKKLEKDGLSGVIIGKALYEGRFTLTQALAQS